MNDEEICNLEACKHNDHNGGCNRPGGPVVDDDGDCTAFDKPLEFKHYQDPKMQLHIGLVPYRGDEDTRSEDYVLGSNSKQWGYNEPVLCIGHEYYCAMLRISRANRDDEWGRIIEKAQEQWDKAMPTRIMHRVLFLSDLHEDGVITEPWEMDELIELTPYLLKHLMVSHGISKADAERHPLILLTKFIADRNNLRGDQILPGDDLGGDSVIL